MKRFTATGPLVGGSLYFLYYAAASCLAPFLSLYYVSRGLSGTQSGILLSLPAVAVMFGAGFWGTVADRTNRHRLVFQLSMIGTIIAALLLPYARGFLGMGLIVLVYAVTLSGLSPLLDAMVLNSLGQERHRYGRVRLWGSIGWGVAGAAIGALVDVHGLTVVFAGYAVILSLGVGVSVLFPRQPAPSSSRLTEHLTALLGRPRFVGLLAAVVLQGTMLGVLTNYLFVRLKELGASGLILGLSLTVATLSEIVFYLLSPMLIRRFGTRRVLYAAILIMAVRLFLYVPLRTPAFALVIQLLHGPSFSMFQAASVGAAHELSPAGSASTAQGVMTAANFGLGGMIGAFGGGVLLQTGGTATLFAATSILALAGFSALVVSGRLRRLGPS